MKLTTVIYSVALSSFVWVGCDNSAQKGDKSNNQPTIENLTNNPKAKKQALFLRLVDNVLTDSSVVYTAKSVFEKDTVALKVEVLKNIQPGINNSGKVDADNGFVQGTIRLSSLGAPSDAFVKALGTMFNLPNTGKMTSEVLLPTVFSSNKEVVDLGKTGTYNFKLFFDNAKGEPAEVFAIIDTYRKSFEITEKDASFRAQLLSAFEGQ